MINTDVVVDLDHRLKSVIDLDVTEADPVSAVIEVDLGTVINPDVTEVAHVNEGTVVDHENERIEKGQIQEILDLTTVPLRLPDRATAIVAVKVNP